MKITVQCECDNNAILQILNRKTIVVRDNLEKDGFYCTEAEIKDGNPKKFCLKCNNCSRWIILDME